MQVQSVPGNMNRDSQHDGGLSITPEMHEILDKPGFISIDMGSERLRNMFQKQFTRLDLDKLSPLALACMYGDYDVVKEAVDACIVSDLNSTQTPFQFGFVALTVLGAQRVKSLLPDASPRHLDIINHLVDAGASPDVPDVSGHTALHHACTPPVGHVAITKLLLEKGANVNAQNRYGEVPLCMPFQGGDVGLINLLMEHGADLDIPDGNDDTPRKMCLVFGPKVTATVQRWERKRKGEVAPLEGRRCENCKVKGSGLKQCSRCQVVRYCSTECQRAHWRAHKPACNPFSAATTATLRPNYDGMSGTISRADFMRQASGLATPSTRVLRPGLTRNTEAENKSMVIKVQVPFSLATSSPVDSVSGPLFIYNRKRDFVCTVSRTPNPEGYDAVVQMVRSRGVGGAKAYFVAELKNPDELVVKVSEVLAEQPF